MLNIKTTATRGKLESLLQKINLPNLFSYYIKSTSSANVDHGNPNNSNNIHVLKPFGFMFSPKHVEILQIKIPILAENVA